MSGVVSGGDENGNFIFAGHERFTTLPYLPKPPLDVPNRMTAMEKDRRRFEPGIPPTENGGGHLPPNFEQIESAPGTPKTFFADSLGPNHCSQKFSGAWYLMSSS
jgi:hypothetical protein